MFTFILCKQLISWSRRDCGRDSIYTKWN